MPTNKYNSIDSSIFLLIKEIFSLTRKILLLIIELIGKTKDYYLLSHQGIILEEIKNDYLLYWQDSVLDKIKNRISELEKIGYEDELNINNMRFSKKLLLLFIEEVIFLDYYSVVLDDDGYYTLRMKNENTLLLLTFKNNNIHFYINSKEYSNSGDTTLEELFSNIDSSAYENFFIQKKVNMYVDNETHLVRFCPKRKIDDKTNEFSELAFKMREYEISLSFNLAEHHKKGSLKENIISSIKAIGKKFKFKKKDTTIRNFSVLYTKDIRERCGDKITKIEQENPNESHVGLYYDKIYEDDVATELARIANESKDEIISFFEPNLNITYLL